METTEPSTNHNFEILAPAGSKESIAAAVLSKADAVYFGFKGGNARGRAENFTNLELLQTIEFLRKNNLKSYITMNTIVLENELEQIEKKLKILSINPPDAVIFQDLSIVELGKQILPETEFHASTQLGICNLDGLQIMEKLGVTRAVLARELTFEEIKKLSKKTNIELEVFVFGAMCYSASGFCYASLINSGRSGNRGVCSQICRTQFQNTTPFSMKDLNLTEETEKLIKAGVYSFKIEGRMKGADYVSNTVKSLKILKDGKFSEESKQESKNFIQSILMRETGKGYFYGLNENIFTKEKHSLQTKVGIVTQLHNKKLKIDKINQTRISVGNRIKINGKGAVITGINKNIYSLSTDIKGKKGDIVELFPNKDSVKGIQGQVNSLSNTIIPIEITIEAEISKNLFKVKAQFNNKTLFSKTYEIESEKSDLGITKEILNKKLKSPHYRIKNLTINHNSLFVQHSLFKTIKKELTEILKDKENFILNLKTNLYKNYPEFNYTEEKQGFTTLPPVYYNKLTIKNTEKIIINNIGQLNYSVKQKTSGKFLPITNKIAANTLTQLGVQTFLKPYELQQDTAPYFVVRKLPKNLPSNFKVEKLDDVYLIFK